MPAYGPVSLRGLRMQEPLPPEQEEDLSSEFEAGKAYGRQIRKRFVAPRVDDPGLPLTDALVCISGALFIAQWALSPAVPPSLKIPVPSWLSPTPLPGGVESANSCSNIADFQ